MSTRAKGGINSLANLIARRHQEHATLQQSISEMIGDSQKEVDATFSKNNRRDGIILFSAHLFGYRADPPH